MLKVSTYYFYFLKQICRLSTAANEIVNHGKVLSSSRNMEIVNYPKRNMCDITLIIRYFL